MGKRSEAIEIQFSAEGVGSDIVSTGGNRAIGPVRDPFYIVIPLLIYKHIGPVRYPFYIVIPLLMNIQAHWAGERPILYCAAHLI